MKRPQIDSAALKAHMQATLAGWARSPARLLAGVVAGLYLALGVLGYVLGMFG
jgi:hypothetical protein